MIKSTKMKNIVVLVSFGAILLFALAKSQDPRLVGPAKRIPGRAVLICIYP